MKKILPILLALVALSARAQVTEGVTWYDGELGYSARNMAAGKVLMNAMAEGEELEFLLVPIAGKKDTYQLVDGPNDCVNPYSKIATVRRMKEGKLDVLCFYDAANLLQAVFSNEGDVWNTDELNRERWMGQLAGEYFFNEYRTTSQALCVDSEHAAAAAAADTQRAQRAVGDRRGGRGQSPAAQQLQ